VRRTGIWEGEMKDEIVCDGCKKLLFKGIDDIYYHKKYHKTLCSSCNSVFINQIGYKFYEAFPEKLEEKLKKGGY
jgi:hypothetical protein